MKETDRSPTPENNGSQTQRGRLVAAFLCGCFVTIGVFVLLQDFFYASFGSVAVILGVSLLAGGFVSGAILEPNLNRRRWGLLWLFFASPAMPVWWAAVFAAIYETEETSSFLPEIAGLCFPPAVGSVIGYYAAHQYRRRNMRR